MEEIEKLALLESEKKLVEGLKKFAQYKRDKRKARNLKLKANGGLREFKPNGKV